MAGSEDSERGFPPCQRPPNLVVTGSDTFSQPQSQSPQPRGQSRLRSHVEEEGVSFPFWGCAVPVAPLTCRHINPFLSVPRRVLEWSGLHRSHVVHGSFTTVFHTRLLRQHCKRSLKAGEKLRWPNQWTLSIGNWEANMVCFLQFPIACHWFDYVNICLRGQLGFLSTCLLYFECCLLLSLAVMGT